METIQKLEVNPITSPTGSPSADRVQINEPLNFASLSLALQSKDDMDRRRGLAVLSRLKKPEAIPYLIPLLEDPISDIVLETLLALGEIKDPSALPAIGKMLTDSRPTVRVRALTAYSKIPGIHHIPVYLEGLGDSEEMVRQTVIRLIGNERDPSTVPALAQLLGREEEEVNLLRLAQAMVGIGNAEVLQVTHEALLSKREKSRRTAAIILRDLKNPTTLGWLLTSAEDGDALVRKISIDALKNLGNLSAVPTILKSLLDPDSRVRMASLDALAVLKDPSSVPSLLEIMRDPDPEIANKAAFILGDLKDPLSLPKLLLYLKDLNPLLRARSAQILGMIGDKKTIPALGEALNDEVDDVSLQVLDSLDHFHDFAIVPWVVLGLESRHPHLLSKANVKLKGFQYSKVLDILLDQLEDRDPVIRFSSIRALRVLKNPSTLVALRQNAAKDPEAHIRLAAQEVILEIERKGAFKRILKVTLLSLLVGILILFVAGWFMWHFLF